MDLSVRIFFQVWSFGYVVVCLSFLCRCYTDIVSPYQLNKLCFSITPYSVVKAATTVAIITTAVVVSATTRGAAAAVAT